jgi:hypothetical protein
MIILRSHSCLILFCCTSHLLVKSYTLKVAKLQAETCSCFWPFYIKYMLCLADTHWFSCK